MGIYEDKSSQLSFGKLPYFPTSFFEQNLIHLLRRHVVANDLEYSGKAKLYNN